ncbi:MAG: hypothetical protein GX777_03080 [Fastidiosipila sp.]|nr:hypothetical protein [Fastidiosipila sp.]
MAEIIVAIISANAVFGFIQFLIIRYDQKKQSPEKMMLKALGAYRLKIMLRRWKCAEVRTAAEWELLEMLYHGYIALGGNGEIKKLYDECAQVKTTE